MLSLRSARHVSFMFSDSFFLLSHACYVIYIPSVLHSRTARLYRPVSDLLVSSLGIDLISGFLSPLVLVVASDARPSSRSSSRDVSIGVVLVDCRTHLPRVRPPVDPSPPNRHAI
jgi:hypothetical protein